MKCRCAHCAKFLAGRACRPTVRRGLIILLTACVISLLLHDSPISRYVLATEAGEKQRLLVENEERIQRSELFLQNYRASLQAQKPARHLGADSAAEVGVTVLTMSRGRRMSRQVTYRTQYLTQSLARLLHLLNDTSLTRSYRLSVCDVDDKPDLFTEAIGYENMVPFFKPFGDPSAKPHQADTVWEKLKHDYVYCLQQTMSLGVRYALLVEDDAIAHAQLFPVLEHVLGTVMKAAEAHGPHVTYVKLFHPKRLLGYISLEVERLTELVALALVLGAVLALSCSRSSRHLTPPVHASNGAKTRERGDTNAASKPLCMQPPAACTKIWMQRLCRPAAACTRRMALFCRVCTRRDGNHDAESTYTRQLLLSWAGWATLVALVALILGRVSLLELRRLSPQLYQVTPAPSCCTPAMLFTELGAEQIGSYLLNVTCTSIKSTDYWIEEFRRASADRALLVQPNLFKHIGMVSSLRTKEVNPLLVQ